MVNSVKAVLTAATVLGSVAVAHAQVGGTAYNYNGSYDGAVYGAKAPSVIKANELNISGAVGLPLNPTAQIPAKGEWRVQGSYYDLGSGDKSGVSYSQKKYGIYTAGRLGSLPMEINLGISNLDVNAKGYSGAHPDDPVDVDGTGFSVGAKYQMWQSNDGTAMASVGVGYDAALYKNLYAYVVASKAFSSRHIVGHLGLRYDHFKIGGYNSSHPSVFLGAEVPIDKRGRFALVGEVQSKNSNSDQYNSKVPFSLALRLANEKGLSASIGIQRQGTLTSVQPGTMDGSASLFFQLGKNF